MDPFRAAPPHLTTATARSGGSPDSGKVSSSDVAVNLTLTDGTRRLGMPLDQAVSKGYVRVTRYTDGFAADGYGNFRVGFGLGKGVRKAGFGTSRQGSVIGSAGDPPTSPPGAWDQGDIWRKNLGAASDALKGLYAAGHRDSGDPASDAMDFANRWWPDGHPSATQVAAAMGEAATLARRARVDTLDRNALVLTLRLNEGALHLVDGSSNIIVGGNPANRRQMKGIREALQRIQDEMGTDIVLLVDGLEESAVARTLAGGGGGRGPRGPRVLVASGGEEPRRILFDPDARIEAFGAPQADPRRRGASRIVTTVRGPEGTALLIVSDTRTSNLLAFSHTLRRYRKPETPPASQVFATLAALRKRRPPLNLSRMQVSLGGSVWVRNESPETRVASRWSR